MNRRDTTHLDKREEYTTIHFHEECILTFNSVFTSIEGDADALRIYPWKISFVLDYIKQDVRLKYQYSVQPVSHFVHQRSSGMRRRGIYRGDGYVLFKQSIRWHANHTDIMTRVERPEIFLRYFCLLMMKWISKEYITVRIELFHVFLKWHHHWHSIIVTSLVPPFCIGISTYCPEIGREERMIKIATKVGRIKIPCWEM